MSPLDKACRYPGRTMTQAQRKRHLDRLLFTSTLVCACAVGFGLLVILAGLWDLLGRLWR